MNDVSRNGNEDFVAFYQQHFAEIEKYFQRKLKGRYTEADDLIQRTMTIVYERWNSIEGKKIEFLYGVARRLLADHRKKDASSRNLVVSFESLAPDSLELTALGLAADPAENARLFKDHLTQLERALKLMPANRAAVLRMTADNLTDEEIALELDLAVGTIPVYRYRARMQLAKILATLHTETTRRDHDKDPPPSRWRRRRPSPRHEKED